MWHLALVALALSAAQHLVIKEGHGKTGDGRGETYRHSSLAQRSLKAQEHPLHSTDNEGENEPGVASVVCHVGTCDSACGGSLGNIPAHRQAKPITQPNQRKTSCGHGLL